MLFRSSFFVPEPVLAAGPVRLSCAISRQPAGAITCESPGNFELRGRFPLEETAVRLDFTVESAFQVAGDSRDLGVCVPLSDASQRHLQRIPLRIS